MVNVFYNVLDLNTKPAELRYALPKWGSDIFLKIRPKVDNKDLKFPPSVTRTKGETNYLRTTSPSLRSLLIVDNCICA